MKIFMAKPDALNCGYKFHSLIIHHIASRMLSKRIFRSSDYFPFNLLLGGVFHLPGKFPGRNIKKKKISHAKINKVFFYFRPNSRD